VQNRFKEYWIEEEDKHVIETSKGFIAYQVLNSSEFFVSDMFVDKDQRQSGGGQELGRLAEITAKELNCKHMTCNIWVKNPVVTTRKVRIFNDFGFNIVSTGNGFISMLKELKYETTK